MEDNKIKKFLRSVNIDPDLIDLKDMVKVNDADKVVVIVMTENITINVGGKIDDSSTT